MRMIIKKTLTLFMIPAILLSFSMACSKSQPEELVVYTSRKTQQVKPLFDAFSKKTGINIRFETNGAGPLMERLKAEGEQSPADIFLTVDAGNLWQASNEGLFQKTDSPVLTKNIPAHLRDPEGQWFGLSVRARTIVYSKERVKKSELSSYADLGGNKWKNKLCLRTSNNVYNQSLVAMMIARVGEEKTQKIVKSWVENLATEVFPSDTNLIKAIAAGQCDVGIVNTYYVGRLIAEDPNYPVTVFWPNQKGEGVHVNVSGGGIVQHSKNPEAAKRFLEWVSSSEGQNILADTNHEFPANPEVSSSQVVASWGEFKANLINVSKAGELQASAIKLMDRASFK